MRILIADDVSEMRSLLRQTVESLGCEVVGTTTNGRDTLFQIDVLKPDLVFLDIDMPDKSGFEVLDELKKKDKNYFTVIVSGFGTIDYVKKAVSKGASGYIVKPYSTQKIQQVLDKFNCTNKNNHPM